MRRGLVLLLLTLAGGIARADDPPKLPVAPPAAPPTAPTPAAPVEKPAPPPTPEQAADAVLAAVKAKDTAALKAIAEKEAPDPWLVADELIRRGMFDGADAFAKAAPRVDVEKLPVYVASRLGNPDDVGRRSRLVRAEAALARKMVDEALREFTPLESAAISDVVGIRLASGRCRALELTGKPEEASVAGLSAAVAAERIEWLARAASESRRAGSLAQRGGLLELAMQAFELSLSICERRRDAAGIAGALSSVAAVHLARHDLKSALPVLLRAVSAFEAVGDERSAATALSNVGTAYAAMGDRTNAASTLERALAAMETLGDRSGLAKTLGSRGNLRYQMSDYDGALADFERAMALFDVLGDKLGAATRLGSIAIVEEARGEHARAMSTYLRALAAQESLGDLAGAAKTLGNLGNVYAALGDNVMALSTYRRALAAKQALHDDAGAARTLGNIGVVQEASGEHAKALLTYERALEAEEAAGDTLNAAGTLANIGSVHFELGDYAKALAFHGRALKIQESIGDKAGAAGTMGSIGNVHFATGEYAQALSFHERELAILELLGDGARAAQARHNIATVRAKRGEHAEALAIFERVLAEKNAVGDVAGAARTLVNIGAIQAEMGKNKDALDTLERALSESELVGDKGTAAHALGRIGATYAVLGDGARALSYARRAVLAIASTVRGLGAEEGAGARESSAFIYEVGARAAVATEDATALFFFLESGRAGALLEGLRAHETLWSVQVPSSLRTEDALARLAVTTATGALMRARDGGDLAEIRRRRADLVTAQERMSSVIARIQREAKAAASIVYPEPATLDAVRSLLVEGDALVIYGVFERESFALVVTRESARIVRLGASAPIRDAVRALEEGDEPGDASGARAVLRDKGSDPTPAIAILSRLVVAPLLLSESTKRLLVSPMGPLGYMPFSALEWHVTVTYIPSASTLQLLNESRGPFGEGVLALGDPDYRARVGEHTSRVDRGGRLERLPATALEAQAVGTVTLLSGEATEAGFVSALARHPRWRAVHLACHGLVDTERPALSSLAITAAGDDDGLLTCLEIFQLKIAADLVVLSACETGTGRIVESEGIVGLTRAFMFAGSPRVICSLWKVDDDATRALMVKFYELWNPKDGKPGLPTAEALKKAQEFVKSQPKWKHPYYWAAWVLWGLPD